MIERRKIVAMAQAGNALALVTLVNVEGSSYRNEGARLLIGRDGDYAGSVSGGCLEAEILRKAHWLTRTGAAVQRYSTQFDDTAEIPYGLGCGGTVDVLIEPANTPEFEAEMQAMAASLKGEERHSETRYASAGKILLRRITDSRDRVVFQSSDWQAMDLRMLFSEVLAPPQRLFVFGAGDDAQPMVRMSSLLGWTTYVLDGRAQWARSERFPEAEQVVAGDQLGTLQPQTRDAVILMTHSYEQDREWLKQVLPCAPRYIGLLGSRHRSALLIHEVAETLHWSVSEACANTFSPIGLDLGGDGAEAIALSAVAEIQAYTQGKLGRSRRMTADTVAEQIVLGSTYPPTPQCAL